MTTVKHTPGPWRTDDEHGCRWNVEDAHGEGIALAQQILGDAKHAERTANAKLLAAAPELADALETALDCETGLSGLCTSCRLAAAAALKKAGRTP